MDFVIKFSARAATLFQTFARMPILFIFCKFYKAPSTKGGKSLCFLLLLPAAGPSLLRRPRFLSPQAANLLISSCFFQPKPLASAKFPLSFATGGKSFASSCFFQPQAPRFCEGPFSSTKAASLLPPLASSSRNPSFLRSSRLYEVLAFIQKLTFEKKPKGSPLDKLETVWKRTEVIPANFHRPHSLEASPETCAGLKPPG